MSFGFQAKIKKDLLQEDIFLKLYETDSYYLLLIDYIKFIITSLA